MEHFITVSEAATLSGKSYSTIWRWGMKGKIRMENHAGVRMVSENSLLAYIAPKPVVTEVPPC